MKWPGLSGRTIRGSLCALLVSGCAANRAGEQTLLPVTRLPFDNCELGSRFLGNRYAGLHVRPTLLRAAAIEPLPAATRAVLLPGHDTYLRFAYAPRYGRVYAVSPAAIGTYALGAPTNHFTTIPYPNLTGPIVVDDQQGVLYAAATGGRLIVCALTAAGLPAADGQAIPTGLANITALALHPRTRRVYAVGDGSAVTNADERIIVVPCQSAANQAVVSPDKPRLYVVTQNLGGQNLAVWPLDADGRLIANEPMRYADGLPLPPDGQRGQAMAVALAPRRRLLFVGGGVQHAPPPSTGVAVHQLDANGDPTGPPTFHATHNPQNSTWALAVSTNEQFVFECGWGWPQVTIWPIGPDGKLQPPTEHISHGHMGKSAIITTPDGQHLLVGSNPGVLEVTEFNPDGSFVKGVTTQLAGQPLGMLRAGVPGDWINLDAALKDGVVPAVVRGEFTGLTMTNARLRFEFALADRAPFKTLTEDYRGNTFAFFAPRYGSDDTNQIPALIESTSDRYRRHRRIAEKYALKPEEQPKQFLVANGLISIDSSPGSLDAGLALLKLLGHNTLEIWHWGNFSPAEIRAKAAAHGINRFRLAVYNPPAYFDYERDKVQPDFLDQWAAQFVQKGRANMGAALDEIRLFHLADEPGWYFPYMLDVVATNSVHRAGFHDYLKSKAFEPAFFGKTNWNEVAPIRLSRANSLPERRLLFWTARFYAESFSRGLHAATAALQRQFHKKLLTTINLNNWPGRFFMPSPGKKIGNNWDTGPDAAMGMPDWFDLGRKRATSCFWTEDWFGDDQSQLWSVYSDLMRCAAREGGLEFGAYVVGIATGAFPEGGTYKIMALAGHGAKAFDFYTFGPYPASGDSWSEHEPSYQSLAEGVRVLGRSEALLYPGRPRNGTVAILFPQASQVWDPDAGNYSYLSELYGLHTALVHEQYPVDFIDDVGVETGDLTKYGYQVLYVTAPNLSVKAQRAIADWVAAGGTLVMLPDAATADEYNEPTRELAQIMGVARGPANRTLWPVPDERGKQTPTAISVTDPRLGAHSLPAHGQFVALQPDASARVLASAGDKPALVESPHGQGRVYSYAYWPGNVYWESPDRTTRERLPTGWSATARRLATAPAALGNARKFVEVSEPGVEACLLESEKGLAITLLNWTGAPLDQITMTISNAGRIAKARSVRQGPLAHQTTGAGLEVKLPLRTVDVLLLHR